jgi:ATP-dependent protease Clp ATPase subunit
MFGGRAVRHCEDSLSCSFCAKGQHQVRKIIRAASAAAICDECVRLSADMLRDDCAATRARPANPPPLPDDMASILEAIRRYGSN